MAANNGGGLLPGGPWNPSPFLGGDAPYELSPQHFSELASELQSVKTRQRQRQDNGLNINNYSLNLSTTAPVVAAPSRHLQTLIPPPQAHQLQQKLQQQGGGLDPGQNQAAGHISRLYNHMLLQLPIEVQQRAQHHLLLRTANVSKSGVPVQQATMLVQQELLPLMQQAFMRLQQAGAITEHAATVTTNPVTIGTRVGVALPSQQQQQQQQRGSGVSHHVAGGGLSASAMESIAKGKAVAAPAIAATEAVIETHRRSNRQQHVVQHQQQQPAAASEHQMQLIRQLQAMQALHMHSTTTTHQQQQQQHERKSSAAAAALPTAVPSYTSNPHQQQKLAMDGSAQELIAGLATNQPTIAIAPPPPIINIHTTINSNSQKRSNGMNWGDIDTGLATSAGAYLHHQQKKQRGVGAVTTPTTTAGDHGNHGQLLDQWSDLFGASAAGGGGGGISNINNVSNRLPPRGFDAALNRKNSSAGVGDVNGGGSHYFLPSIDILNSMPLPTNTTNTNHNLNSQAPPSLLHTKDAGIVNTAVGVAALSRGRVASAKIQAKQATQRYSWTAGMLNEIFIPTPVDETGLLKQEQTISINMPPPPQPPLLPSMSMSPRAKGAAYGTEGQRMLADAAQRVHQGVVLPNTFTFPTTVLATTALAAMDHGNGGDSSSAPMNGGINHTRVDVDVHIVPVSVTVTQLQVALTPTATTTTAAAAQESQVNPSLVTEAELFGFDDGPPLQLGDFLSTE